MERPFNLTKAKLTNVKGNDSKYFHTSANKTASSNNNIINKYLRFLDIFLNDVFAINLNKK